MESTVMISSLLCNILIGCFCIVVLSWQWSPSRR